MVKTVAHQGSHLQDQLQFILSFNFTTNKFNSAFNFYQYDTELVYPPMGKTLNRV